jgi:SAM-dependent methyltransferase
MENRIWLEKALDYYYWKPAHGFCRAIDLAALAKYAPHIDPPCLDLGCGDGIFWMLKGETSDCLGFDISMEALGKARDLGVYFYGVACGSATELPFNDNVFNTVFSNSVFEHITDIDSVVQEVSRILTPGGRLILTVPSDQFDDLLFFAKVARKLRLERVARWYIRGTNARLKAIHSLSAEAWGEKLMGSGLEIEWSAYYMPAIAMNAWNLLSTHVLRVFTFARFLPPYARMLVKKAERWMLGPVFARAQATSSKGGTLLVIACKRS